MAALDDPERWTFRRADKTPQPEILARWTDVLAGKPLLRYLERSGIAQGVRNVRAFKERQRAKQPLRPGVSRGGRPIGDAGDPDRGPR